MRPDCCDFASDHVRQSCPNQLSVFTFCLTKLLSEHMLAPASTDFTVHVTQVSRKKLLVIRPPCRPWLSHVAMRRKSVLPSGGNDNEALLDFVGNWVVAASLLCVSNVAQTTGCGLAVFRYLQQRVRLYRRFKQL